MAATDSVLVTGRRNFLVRALGFTAAGATLAVPVLAVTTPQERIKHHLKGLQEALQDQYGAPAKVSFTGSFDIGLDGTAGPATAVAMVSVMPEAAGRVRWFLDTGNERVADVQNAKPFGYRA